MSTYSEVHFLIHYFMLIISRCHRLIQPAPGGLLRQTARCSCGSSSLVVSLSQTHTKKIMASTCSDAYEVCGIVKQINIRHVTHRISSQSLALLHRSLKPKECLLFAVLKPFITLHNLRGA